MSRIQPEVRRKLEEEIIRRVWDNPDFMEEFSKNPNLMLEQEFGVELPKDTKVTIHKEKVNEIHIVIPKF